MFGEFGIKPEQRVAVYIDFHSISYATMSSTGQTLDYVSVREYLEDNLNLLRIKAYATQLNNTDHTDNIRPITDFLDYNGYHVVRTGVKSRNYSKSDNSNQTYYDVVYPQMTADMVYNAENADVIIVMTASENMIPAIETAMARGTRVHVMFPRDKEKVYIPDRMLRISDGFINFKLMLDDMSETDYNPYRPQQQAPAKQEDTAA